MPINISTLTRLFRTRNRLHIFGVYYVIEEIVKARFRTSDSLNAVFILIRAHNARRDSFEMSIDKERGLSRNTYIYELLRPP